MFLCAAHGVFDGAGEGSKRNLAPSPASKNAHIEAVSAPCFASDLTATLQRGPRLL